MYWACLLECRYSQVPGVDFPKSNSLAVNKITFHILLLMVIHFGFSAKIIDVKTAFLYGDLDDEIDIEFPNFK